MSLPLSVLGSCLPRDMASRPVCPWHVPAGRKDRPCRGERPVRGPRPGKFPGHREGHHLTRKKRERSFSFTQGKCSGNFIIQNLPARISPLWVPDTARAEPELGGPLLSHWLWRSPSLRAQLLTLHSPGHLLPAAAEGTAGGDPPASSRVSHGRSGCPSNHASGCREAGLRAGRAVHQSTNTVLCGAAGVRRSPGSTPTHHGGLLTHREPSV